MGNSSSSEQETQENLGSKEESSSPVQVKEEIWSALRNSNLSVQEKAEIWCTMRNSYLSVKEMERITGFFEDEHKYMAAEDYSLITNRPRNESLRRNIIHVICMISNNESEVVDVTIPYHAMLLFDLFISKYKRVPRFQEALEEDVKVLGISCFELAWRMRHKASETEFIRNRSNLKSIEVYIRKMEEQILETLDRRDLIPINPFCFVEYFFYMVPDFGFKRQTVIEIIVQAQGDILYTKYRPSVIAASALIAASTPFLQEEEYHIMKHILARCGTLTLEDLRLVPVYLEVMGVAKNVLETQVASAEPEASSLSERSHGEEEIIEEVIEETENRRDERRDEVSMNFELKWITSENEDLALHRSLYYPPFNPSGCSLS